ncbi:N-acetylmuramoyl-L-alanine amidase [Tistlia consotensis]|uniref:N-acetylmuramoyl-L-alanine amidase n=1 Tax=Tistlia consotensis USBA 355 TaxID=560819 RepID=A0A1Y6CQD9_9PROT|nr:N-acetylmuramoyl-L-alanine amidase [Tistlia consotensis]SMF70990.1 N-acetylmuramoyl-L-alanine amidase [Tistlia consotensis USBA 355]SNS07154.1 N-acetylmuramoyl-L-alanine amidase [Tistlia consotensis]
MDRQPSPNHDARPPGQAVEILLLHYTGMPSAAAALERLCDPAAKVSAHYLVDEDGRVVQLVEEHRRAWHAGHAEWRGRAEVNARSIGIELVNPGHEWGYRAFPEAQMTSLIELCLGILERHPVPPRQVLGHSDVAPLRKEDPGELFDWPRLAAAGIGLWPAEAAPLEPDPERARRQLAGFGYSYLDQDPAAVLRAFQRHFRPAAVTGALDAETAGRLGALSALL